jgi:transcriptional regulator with XRE-family HTH domain
MEQLVALLKMLRIRARLSQNELSLKAKLSETYYGKIEGEHRQPSAMALIQILAVLDCSEEEEQQALRLYAKAKFPGLLEGLMPSRPPVGTAGSPVAPWRKPRVADVLSSARRRRRRTLPVVFAALVMGGGTADTIPYPLTFGSTGSLLSDMLRRWFGIPAPAPCSA